MTINEIIEENERRNAKLFAPFDPLTGEGSVGKRRQWRGLWLPAAMIEDPEMDKLANITTWTENCNQELERLRIKHDFAYWCAKYVYIKPKGGGEDCLFRLSYPQRKFVERLEEMRLTLQPIRIVLLKARQWGGSTVSQLYMAWLQLVHCKGLNSLIIAHQGSGSDEIKDMFDRMIKAYPVSLLHEQGEKFDPNEKKLVGVGRSQSIYRVPQRNCKIKIGSAERPDSCRGGDYNLVHLSEVGLWKATKGKKPEDIIRAACGGVLYRPNTMLVYESTANGIGNFFHREYMDARDLPACQFKSLFISWFDIEQNWLKIDDIEGFVSQLLEKKDNQQEPNSREESGRYLWSLWEKGATLEGINWYITERGKHMTHGSMAAECPSDDIEAFVNSGENVFDKYQVEALRPGCKMPAYVGEVQSMSGDQSIDGLCFKEDSQGQLWVWVLPNDNGQLSSQDRYLTVVDIGGRSIKADWSVIVVFDREPLVRGEGPEVVAQWYGHIDMDLLAWKAMQIAAFYQDSLLVIESNTLETHDPMRQVDGDQSGFILNEIRKVYWHLYARRRKSEDVNQGSPTKYGFHTNVSTKPMVISTLIKIIREGLYVERDERCLNELLVYERKANGSLGAIQGAHDDLLMTRAIGLHIAYYEMNLPTPSLVWTQRPGLF